MIRVDIDIKISTLIKHKIHLMKAKITLLFLFIAPFIFGQRNNRLWVISPNGVNMRAAPNTQSKIMASLPWMTKVEILDTIGEAPINIGIFHEFEWKEGPDFMVRDTVPLSGQWVKAKTGKTTGYIFNAFLADTSGNCQNNKEYSLLYEYWNCIPNFNYNPSWNWYGLYESENKIQVKKVDMRFIKSAEELGDFYLPCTHEKVRSMCIIGSKKPMKMPKEILQNVDYSCQFNWAYEDSCSQKALKEANMSLDITGPENERVIKLYLLGKNGQKQLLNPPDRFVGEHKSPASIWHGDLDGDGKMDYIIHYGEASSITVLYLSSEAEKGQMVKAVAFYCGGYCC